MCMCVQAHVYGHMFKAEYLNVLEKGHEDHSTFLETVRVRAPPSTVQRLLLVVDFEFRITALPYCGQRTLVINRLLLSFLPATPLSLLSQYPCCFHGVSLIAPLQPAPISSVSVS